MILSLSLTQTELQGVMTLVWLLIAIALGVSIHSFVYWLLDGWATSRHNVVMSAVVRQTRRPAAYIIPLLAILVIFPELDIPPRWRSTAVHVTGLLTIAAMAWTLIAMVRLYADIVVARHRIDVEDNLLARELGTRVDILSRVVITVIIIFAVGMMLMTFPEVRSIGTTVIASAGLAGIVAGLAARPLFENLVAGIQLALTVPIRIDDVVIVEKQYGRIEEIHTTYVVVRIWDLRRLIVPLTYFITTPFENWTRRTANLMGEVYIVADWTLDVDSLRAEIPKIVERSALWDRQFQNLQVTDATDRGVTIRALVTARNSGDLWDLRCFVREQIVAFIRDHQPHAFPRLRVDVPERARNLETEERIAKTVAAADGRQSPER
jgi:small-conductance mechanosensitive channel